VPYGSTFTNYNSFSPALSTLFSNFAVACRLRLVALQIACAVADFGPISANFAAYFAGFRYGLLPAHPQFSA
jgi:hypothetical protein